MSLTHDGQRVVCDGEGCGAEALLPVALRPTLSRDTNPSSGIDGWLFAVGHAERRHFCPRCVGQYLSGLTGRDDGEERAA